MKIASLGSGSKGNSTIISGSSGNLMVDNGFSVRETEKRLEDLGVHASSLEGILVTHEHSDHCNGVARLARKYELPVYLTHGTCVAMAEAGKWYGHDCDVQVILPEEIFSICGISIRPVPVPHDAREPVQYLFTEEDIRLGVLTDLGCETPHIIEQYSDCHGLLIESNHDRHMLLQGSYPPALKRRVGGDYGHLSNCQMLSIMQKVVTSTTRKVILGHLSEDNNSESKVRETVSDFVRESGLEVIIAGQHSALDWVEI